MGGAKDVVECTFVENSLTAAPYFSTPVSPFLLLLILILVFAFIVLFLPSLLEFKINVRSFFFEYIREELIGSS